MNVTSDRERSVLDLFLSADATGLSQNRKLELRFSERKILLSAGDSILVLLGFFLVLWPIYLAENAISVSLLTGYMVLFPVLLLCINFVLGLYNLDVASSFSKASVRVIASIVIASFTLLTTLPLANANPVTWREILYVAGITSVALLAWRWVYAAVIAKFGLPEPILIIGAGVAGKNLAGMLQGAQDNHRELTPYEVKRHNQMIGYRTVGFIDDDPEKEGLSIAGVPVLGNSSKLIEFVKQYQPNQVVLAVTKPDSISPELFQTLMECRTLGVDVTTMLALYETIVDYVPLNHIGANIAAVLSQPPSGISRFYQFARRIFDIFMGIYGCALMILIIPFIWIINRIYSPGPLFYSQERIGKAGVPFKIVKFRSMIVDAEKKSGAVWAEEDDPRITPVGRFLRKTRLDELPQFWNILKGEMSLIGPRPERPHFVELLSQQITFYPMRHAVKPGLTGWAQVKYAYTSTVDDTAMKLQYDIFYIKYQGLVLDIKVLLKTVAVVIGLQGR